MEYIDFALAVLIGIVFLDSAVDFIKEMRVFGINATVARRYHVRVVFIPFIYGPIILCAVLLSMPYTSTTLTTIALTACIGRLYKEHRTRLVKRQYSSD